MQDPRAVALKSGPPGPLRRFEHEAGLRVLIVGMTHQLGGYRSLRVIWLNIRPRISNER